MFVNDLFKKPVAGLSVPGSDIMDQSLQLSAIPSPHYPGANGDMLRKHIVNITGFAHVTHQTHRKKTSGVKPSVTLSYVHHNGEVRLLGTMMRVFITARTTNRRVVIIAKRMVRHAKGGSVKATMLRNREKKKKTTMEEKRMEKDAEDREKYKRKEEELLQESTTTEELHK